MKKYIVGLFVLYICIPHLSILLISIAGLIIWYLASLFYDSAGKIPAPMKKSKENPIEKEKEPESYTKEGKPIPDVPVPAGPLGVDPGETGTK